MAASASASASSSSCQARQPTSQSTLSSLLAPTLMFATVYNHSLLPAQPLLSRAAGSSSSPQVVTPETAFELFARVFEVVERLDELLNALLSELLVVLDFVRGLFEGFDEVEMLLSFLAKSLKPLFVLVERESQLLPSLDFCQIVLD
ncbi:hypothetical protein NCS52_01104200 [Fusarium sp. LHS14.1]|nr:hypothetical protein NCS52_01104200 [Fusarium sp. LHS14.1]